MWARSRLVAEYGRLGAALPIAAERHGDRTAVVDDAGSLTFTELDRRSNAIANAWRAAGLRAGDGVAMLVRNHRGFVEAFAATQKLGARAILLNTDFAGPQLREVAEREGTRMLVHDDEFSAAVGELDLELGRWRAWADGPGDDTLDALVAQASPALPPPPAAPGTFIILTSGTTGTPRGAQRQAVEGRTLTRIGAFVGTIPLRPHETMIIASPLFHSLGFVNLLYASRLGSAVVLRRRFDPARLVADIERHRATTVILVPILLARVLDAYDAASPPPDISSLRIVLVAGSQLGATLARRTLATFGDVLYNLYGSTEVAFATIASPETLRRAPGSVGPPAIGSRIRIADADGNELGPGQTGRIFVGNASSFAGYTGGGSKEMLDGMMSSGDVGHLDADGLLYIDGRDDGMIVSGGENVFPDEVEELLAGHPSVLEAAAIGVPDDDFGQRLRAFVVVRDGAVLSAEELREYVRENLARYKVPRDVVFLDALPRNPTGKVLKRELARRDD